MTRTEYFGTHGEKLLCDRYRDLYWLKNDYQLCGVSWDDPAYIACEADMAKIEKLLGYVPEC